MHTGGVKLLRSADDRPVVEITDAGDNGHTKQFLASFSGWRRDYIVGQGWTVEEAVRDLFACVGNSVDQITDCRFVCSEKVSLPAGWLAAEWRA